MTHREVTLKDVADAAGVHVSTASRALNEHARAVVHADTIERVLRAAQKLGYTPNPLAKGLRTNKTMTVGIVISDIENPLFGPIIAGLEEALWAAGYSALVTETGPNLQGALPSVLDALLGRRVDGMVLAMATRRGESAARLVDLQVPVVLLNRLVEGVAVPAVVGDDVNGIGLAVDHLVDLGHVHIGHLAGPSTTSTGLSRREGFVARMRARGLEPDDDVIEEAEWYQLEPGYVAARRLLDRRPDLTALVGANDLIALGAFQAIRELGYEVGREISVTGYNDMKLLDLMHPPLTSVRIPYRQMGTTAAKILLELMAATDDPSGVGEVTTLPATLSIRESTAPPGARSQRSDDLQEALNHQ